MGALGLGGLRWFKTVIVLDPPALVAKLYCNNLLSTLSVSCSGGGAGPGLLRWFKTVIVLDPPALVAKLYCNNLLSTLSVSCSGGGAGRSSLVQNCDRF